MSFDGNTISENKDGKKMRAVICLEYRTKKSTLAILMILGSFLNINIENYNIYKPIKVQNRSCFNRAISEWNFKF